MKRLKLTKAMTRHLLYAAVARTAWAIKRRRLQGDGYTEPPIHLRKEHDMQRLNR